MGSFYNIKTMIIYVNSKKNLSLGFTLIELLVVIIIISILSGIALPVLIDQIHKAKEVEAKQNLSICYRSQQVYYQEYGAFAPTLEQLELGIKTETNNYKYAIEVFNAPNNKDDFPCCIAEAKQPELETYMQCNSQN